MKIAHKLLGFLALLIFNQAQCKDLARNLNINSQEQINEVWVLGDGEKVFKKELNHPSKKTENNLIWDGETIRLKGFYNEILAFQVIVESGKKGAKAVEIKVTNPVNEQGQAIGNSPQMYGDNGTVEIFTQHYLNVTKPSPTKSKDGWYFADNAAPKQMLGWIPDALIPSKKAKSGLGGFPVAIESLMNQGFWIDLHLPRNHSYSGGLYKGSVQVLNEGEVIKEIPLEVTLLPEYLPDENKTNVWVFTEGAEEYYLKYMSRADIETMLKFEGHRHRIEMVGGFYANHIKTFEEKTMNNYKKWLDGSGFTKANGYYGPGQNKGDKYFSISTYNHDKHENALRRSKEGAHADSTKWVDWFDKNSPDTTYFWYVMDEPSTDKKILRTKELAGWVKSNPAKGKNLKIFTTHEYTRELAGLVDYWAGLPQTVNPRRHVEAARKDGGDHIFYNGFRPSSGSVILEGAAIDFRVNSWILYKYGLNTHFIWQSTYWYPSLNGGPSVWKEPKTFMGDDNVKYYGNGDGTLFYPGSDYHHPAEDRGITDTVVPSIRLKNIRRGQQDALILQMAERKLGKEQVLAKINEIVPKALSEADENDVVPWSEKGNDYDQVIEQLRTIIVP